MAMSLVDAAKRGDDLAFEGLLEPQEAALKAWRKLK